MSANNGDDRIIKTFFFKVTNAKDRVGNFLGEKLSKVKVKFEKFCCYIR